MFFYIALSLLPIIASGIIKNRYSNAQRKIYLCIVFGVLGVLICLRGRNVGTDTSHYLRLFDQVRSYGFDAYSSSLSIEYGYFGVMWLMSRLFRNGQVIVIFFSGMTYFIVAYVIYKYSDDVVMSTFLFVVWVLPATANLMRQHFAFALVQLAFVKMLERKKIKALLLILVAVSFHNSAMIFLPFIFVYYVMNRWKGFKGVKILLSAFLIFILFMDQLIQLVAYLVPRYARYLTLSSRNAASSPNMIWLAIYFIFFLMYLIIIRNKTRRGTFAMNEREMAQVYYILLLLLAMVVIVIRKTSTKGLFYRLSAYTIYGSVFIIPYVLRNFFTNSILYMNKHNLRITIAIFYFLFIIWDCLMLRQNPHHIIPFTFCF